MSFFRSLSGVEFKILSIDGGGIKGVFPAYYLTLVEQELAKMDNVTICASASTMRNSKAEAYVDLRMTAFDE